MLGGSRELEGPVLRPVHCGWGGSSHKNRGKVWLNLEFIRNIVERTNVPRLMNQSRVKKSRKKKGVAGSEEPDH